MYIGKTLFAQLMDFIPVGANRVERSFLEIA